MDKLKELFKQLGGSDELVNTLSEELVRFSEELKEQYDRDFKNKIQKARQVCLEEVQKEKAVLARKVSVFLESKLEAIGRAAEKQRLQEETEANNKLKQLRALLENVSLGDTSHNQELQEAKKQLARLNKAFKTLKEERDTVIQKANKANEIALKTLQRNRLLESKVKAQEVIAESKPATPKTSVVGASDGQKQSKKPLVENREMPSASKVTRAPAQSKLGKDAADSRIAGIAAQIEVD